MKPLTLRRNGLLLLVALALAPLAGNPASVPVPRNTWLEHHERLSAQAKKGGVNLLFVGDSLTHRWAGDGKPVWDTEYASLGAANFGISGDRAENVLWRLQNGNLDGIAPKAVVLLVGTNNLALHTPEQVADGIATIVREIHLRIPSSRILLLGLFPRSENPGDLRRSQVVAVNRLISRLDDGQKTVFLDIGAAFLRPDGTLGKDIMPDGLHLSLSGYRVWAAAMRPMLDELLR